MAERPYIAVSDHMSRHVQLLAAQTKHQPDDLNRIPLILLGHSYALSTTDTRVPDVERHFQLRHALFIQLSWQSESGKEHVPA